MKVYCTCGFYNFPSSEYGGVNVWTAASLYDLRTQIEAVLATLNSEDILTIEKIMNSARKIDTTIVGLQYTFDT